MLRRNSLLWLAIAVLAICPASLFGQTVFEGQADTGAYHTIMVPDGWHSANGLVIWNHGFDLGPIGPVTDLGPLVQVQLAEGYAVAASSYSQSGWALFQSNQDLEGMYQDFVENFDVPAFTLVTGGSLGGAVTARAIESAELGNVVGAGTVCGAVAGSRNWNGAIDIRLIYDAVCGQVPGAAIPGGATGLPFPPDPSFDTNALGLAVHTCTGVLAPPAGRTAEQAARLATFLQTTGLPEEFVLGDMGYVTFALADLVWDPAKLGGVQALGNEHVDYGDATINASIQRVAADQSGRKHLLENYTPTGNVGDTKIISIHTDKDGLVIVENESEYASVVPPQNLTVGIVVEDTPTHCGFSDAETLAAWESLRGWVAGLPQPGVADLQATCQGIDLGGLANGPCRFDPNFNIPAMEDRVRPRTSCDEGTYSVCLADRFQAEIQWHDFDGNSGNGRVSNARTDQSASFWFFSPENLELTTKIVDGRNYNGHFWVFYGSLTNVEFTLTVTDTVTGVVKQYDNPSGSFASVGDTSAF